MSCCISILMYHDNDHTSTSWYVTSPTGLGEIAHTIEGKSSNGVQIQAVVTTKQGAQVAIDALKLLMDTLPPAKIILEPYNGFL